MRKNILLVFLMMMASVLGVNDPRDTRTIVLDTDTTLTTCCAEIGQNFSVTFTLIQSISNSLQSGKCTSLLIRQADVGTTGFVITQSGLYALKEDIFFNPAGSTAAITINADNVVLDLQCYSIEQTNNTANVDGISIGANLSHIVVHNGVIKNFTRDALGIAAGTFNMIFFDMKLQNCLNGIHGIGSFGNPINDLSVTAIDFLSNGSGVSLQFVDRALFSECLSIKNIYAGYELISSSSVIIDSCTIKSTGVAVGSAVGISMVSGRNNTVSNCLIDDVTTQDTFEGASAVGILVGATENNDTIINNQISNCITSSNAQPFGIQMQYTVAGFINASGVPQGGLTTALWSPNSYYFATTRFFPSALLRIYQFSPSLKTIVNDTLGSAPGALSWSPDGQFFCVGDTSGVLSVYQFDGVGIQLYASLNFGVDISTAELIQWSSDGRYIAVANTNGFFIVKVTLNAQSGTLQIVSSVSLAGIVGIDWYNSDYLAVTTSALTVYRFTGNKVTLVASLASCIGYSAWSPNGRFIVTEEPIPNSRIKIIAFDGTSLTEVAFLLLNGVGWAWSPDGNYLVSNDGSTIWLIKFFQMNLSIVASVNPTGGTLYAPKWMSTGSYIASVIDTGAFTAGLYQTFVFPSGTVIKNNKISNVRGPALPAGQPGVSSGKGISASSANNLIIGNTAFDNDTNYIFVNNVFEQFVTNAAPRPNLLSNVSFPPL